MIEIIFLGTNGWYDTLNGNTISILIKTENYQIILDAGLGLAKLDEYTNNKKTFLYLSHFHLDHLYGLHTISKNTFPEGLVIFGQPGLKNYIGTLMNHPFTLPFNKMKFTTELCEFPDSMPVLPFGCTFAPLVHSDPCYGVRVIIDDKIISYCPDTGYCSNAVDIAKNADVLITECAFLPGQINKDWPHLNPETAAQIAVESYSKKLLLTHFEAFKYKTPEDRVLAQNTARAVFPESYSSYDGMSVIIE